MAIKLDMGLCIKAFYSAGSDPLPEAAEFDEFYAPSPAILHPLQWKVYQGIARDYLEMIG